MQSETAFFGNARGYKAGDSTDVGFSMGEASYALLTGMHADNLSLAAGPAIVKVTGGGNAGSQDLVGFAIAARWRFGVRKHLYYELSVNSYMVPEVTFGAFRSTSPTRSTVITVPASMFNASHGAVRIGVWWRI